MVRKLNTREAVEKYCEEHGLSKELGHVEVLRNKFYITAAGLRQLAHQQGVQNVALELVHSDFQKNVYVIKATVQMAGENGELKTFEDFGSSSGSGVGRGGKDGHALLGHASTRATARAYRLALDVPLPVFEESGEYIQQQMNNQHQRSNNTPPKQSPAPKPKPAFNPKPNTSSGVKLNGLASLAQIKKYQTTATQEHKLEDGVKHFMLETLFGVDSSTKLTSAQISHVIEKLQKPATSDQRNWVRENWRKEGDERKRHLELFREKGAVWLAILWGKKDAEANRGTE